MGVSRSDHGRAEQLDLFFKEKILHLVERITERVMDQVVECLTERFTASPAIHLERAERPERTERSGPAIAAKAAVLERLRAMQAEGLSLQAIANRLNNEGVPTLGGKGR